MNKIKKVFFVLAVLMFLLSLDGLSQSGKVPPFQMIRSNDKVFLAGNLPIGHPIIIIYFSPDCDDCHRLIEGILKRMDDFRNASIVMLTYLPVENVKQFAARYSLTEYSNIYVGTEGNSLFVRDYYNVLKFPFLALYNKNGDLIKIYNEEYNLDDLSEQLRNL
jgi:hypothetical protein